MHISLLCSLLRPADWQTNQKEISVGHHQTNKAAKLLASGHPYCYFLDTSSRPNAAGHYRVSFVFQHIPGHYPTGGAGVLPWYWDEATCIKRNEALGLSEEEAREIVESSMFCAFGRI